MADFKYRAINTSGEITDGKIKAESRKDALSILKTMKLKPLDLRETKSKTSFFKKSKSFENKVHNFKSGSKLALPFLTRILQLHASGMPIGDTIKILQNRLKHPEQKQLANLIWKDLSEGKSLAFAMSKMPEVFGDDIVYPVEAAEATGNLGPVLKDIIRALKEKESLRKKIIGGLTYPIFVCIVAVGVVALFLFFLLPRLEKMLNALGGEMTLSAKFLIACSNGLIYVGPFILIALFIAILSVQKWRAKSIRGKIIVDRWMLNIPVLGRILRLAEICRISNLITTLLNSGVTLTETMRLTEKVIKNAYLRKMFLESKTKINDGVSFSRAFKSCEDPFFSELALDILTIGESTGKMPQSFNEICIVHGNDLEDGLKFLTKFITSFALGFAFLLVGILALGIVSSVLQFSQSFKL